MTYHQSQRYERRKFFCGNCKTTLTLNVGQVANQIALDLVWGAVVATTGIAVTGLVNKLVQEPILGNDPTKFSRVVTTKSYAAKNQTVNLAVALTGRKLGIEAQLAQIIEESMPPAYALLDHYNHLVAESEARAKQEAELQARVGAARRIVEDLFDISPEGSTTYRLRPSAFNTAATQDPREDDRLFGASVDHSVSSCPIGGCVFCADQTSRLSFGNDGEIRLSRVQAPSGVG